jgi:beta-lactamase class C
MPVPDRSGKQRDEPVESGDIGHRRPGAKAPGDALSVALGGRGSARRDAVKTIRRGTILAVILGMLVIAAIAALVAWRAPNPDGPGAGFAEDGETIVRLAPPLVPAKAKVDYHRIEARIDALMQNPDMVGLAVGTIEDGQVRFVKGYGETLANSGNPVTPDTVFRWASLSKSVASALIVALAEDGKLSLDAPVASMRTTLTVPGGTRAVTIADVLSHRLGLVRNAWDDRLEAGEDPKLLRSALATLAPLCPPATCYAYQNIAYDTASEIVEQVTGKAYAGVAHDRLFAPLGMTRTTIGRAGLESAKSWAQPHRHNRQPATVGDAYYRVPAAGGVNSSIHDLLRWMQTQMGGAPGVLSPAALAAMHDPRVTTPPTRRRGAMDRAMTDAHYGLGWRTYTYAGHALVGHRGSVDGYRSLLLFDPAQRSGIVMLWNSNASKPAGLQLEFLDLLYGLPANDWLQLTAPPTPLDPERDARVIAG